MVRLGTPWYGTVRYAMVRCGTLHMQMARHGAARHGAARHGSARAGDKHATSTVYHYLDRTGIQMEHQLKHWSSPEKDWSVICIIKWNIISNLVRKKKKLETQFALRLRKKFLNCCTNSS